MAIPARSVLGDPARVCVCVCVGTVFFLIFFDVEHPMPWCVGVCVGGVLEVATSCSKNVPAQRERGEGDWEPYLVTVFCSSCGLGLAAGVGLCRVVPLSTVYHGHGLAF